MFRTITFLAVAAVLVSICGSYSFGEPANKQPGNIAQVWEYRVIALADLVSVQQALQADQRPQVVQTIEAKFNQLGRDGWEYSGDLPGTAIFKRLKR
ncbi:hypothetical protein [Planctomicrobium piriforme]|uniref:DUF4177 domain-containing protein n=1 Tax=Planctomicrobium piriforme TaxID=1576369 RepID=A0A1I3EK71_9PLAN|nr:hypothetical protein [Planctomicrobium piriforme]SFH99395.1 hypothetical protein SAMN05421753_104261 [Planctomicrobium piriforme]